jgi:hypothetical protein
MMVSRAREGLGPSARAGIEINSSVWFQHGTRKRRLDMPRGKYVPKLARGPDLK